MANIVTRKPMKAPQESMPPLEKHFRLPLFMSTKYDGMRAIVPPEVGAPRTNSLKEIVNVATRDFFSDPCVYGFDFEMIVGPPNAEDVFNVTSGMLRRIQGDPKAVAYVFDLCDIPTVPFNERLHILQDRVRALPPEYAERVVLVEHKLVHSYADAIAFSEQKISEGYEGGMGRAPKSLYKYGRATLREGTSFKWKPLEDSEAIITEVHEKMHNANEAVINEMGLMARSSHRENLVPAGTLGKFSVTDIYSGVSFDIGVFKGFNAAQKQEMWDDRENMIGKIVKYKFVPVGVVDKPRLPRVVGFRDENDLSYDRERVV